MNTRKFEKKLGIIKETSENSIFLEQLIFAKCNSLIIIKSIHTMDQEETKYNNSKVIFKNKRYYNDEYPESSQEPNSASFKILNSPFTNSFIYVCSSSDFEVGVEALSDDSFEDISEQWEGNGTESEDRSNSFDEDCF